MKLKILRSSQLIYQNEDILELSLDPLSYSGIDYWSQEARMAKVKLLLDEELEEILLGSQREVRCGFHCLSAFIQGKENNVLFSGVLEEGKVNIEYLSLEAKTVEIELMDFLGLVLRLAPERVYRIEEGVTHLDPVETVKEIVCKVLHPYDSDGEPETERYTNADVRRLMQRIAVLTWPYAANEYDYSQWVPYQLRGPLLKIKDLRWSEGCYTHYDSSYSYGFQQDAGGNYFVFWQYAFIPLADGDGPMQHLRYRKYRLSLSRLTLVEQEEWDVRPPQAMVPHPTPPSLQSSLISGDMEYRIEGWELRYKGPASVDATEVVAGDYKADDLLGEMLRTANAVLKTDKKHLSIVNRYDNAMETLNFKDPIEFTVDPADNSAPEFNAVCLAFQDIVDGIQDHYKAVLAEFSHEATLRTHMKAEDVKMAGLSSPYELIDYVVAFQNYRMRPLEVEYDPVTHEIEISGRVKHV